MIVDIKEIASRVKLGSMLVVLVLVAVVVLDLIYAWVPMHILDYLCVALFVIFEAYLFIKKFNYIYYNSDGFKIILKYTSIGMLSAGNFKLEIPKKDRRLDFDLVKEFGADIRTDVMFSIDDLVPFEPTKKALRKCRTIGQFVTLYREFRDEAIRKGMYGYGTDRGVSSL